MNTRHIIVAAIGAVTAMGLAGAGANARDRLQIQVQEGFSEMIPLDFSPGEIIIGNPDIADVVLGESLRYVVLHGNEIGYTNLIILSDAGEVAVDARVRVTPVDIWPETEVRVIFNARDEQSYRCTAEGVCNWLEFRHRGEVRPIEIIGVPQMIQQIQTAPPAPAPAD